MSEGLKTLPVPTRGIGVMASDHGSAVGNGGATNDKPATKWEEKQNEKKTTPLGVGLADRRLKVRLRRWFEGHGKSRRKERKRSRKKGRKKSRNDRKAQSSRPQASPSILPLAKLGPFEPTFHFCESSLSLAKMEMSVCARIKSQAHSRFVATRRIF